MPNWKTHLEIASRLNETYRFEGRELELFMLGNILPDINNCHILKNIKTKISHSKTHYKTIDYPSYKNFYNQYQTIINHPLVLGVYAHLFTDFIWNDNFYRKVEKSNELRNLNHDVLRKLKQTDFQIYNNQFHHQLFITDLKYAVYETKKIKEIDVTEKDLENVIDYIKKNIKYDGELRYYQKEELDCLLENTVATFLKNNPIVE